MTEIQRIASVKILLTLVAFLCLNSVQGQDSTRLSRAIINAFEASHNKEGKHFLIADSLNAGYQMNPPSYRLDLNDLDKNLKKHLTCFSTELYPLSEDSIFVHFQRWDVYRIKKRHSGDKNWSEGFALSEGFREQFFTPAYLVVLKDTEYELISLWNVLTNRKLWNELEKRPKRSYQAIDHYFSETLHGVSRFMNATRPSKSEFETSYYYDQVDQAPTYQDGSMIDEFWLTCWELHPQLDVRGIYKVATVEISEEGIIGHIQFENHKKMKQQELEDLRQQLVADEPYKPAFKEGKPVCVRWLVVVNLTSTGGFKHDLTAIRQHYSKPKNRIRNH